VGTVQINKYVIPYKVVNMKLEGNGPRERPRVRCKEQGRKGNTRTEGRKWKESEEQLWEYRIDGVLCCQRKCLRDSK
jgi:hypothetical protein